MKPTKNVQRQKRSDRIRKKIGDGNAARPRLVVYRSNRAISVQLIDDLAGKTLVSATSLKSKNGGNIAAATEVGKDIAAKAKAQKIAAIVFDRNGYAFHGKVKALAEAARAGGLAF
jgi:large subunit ribosomal protein L18